MMGRREAAPLILITLMMGIREAASLILIALRMGRRKAATLILIALSTNQSSCAHCLSLAFRIFFLEMEAHLCGLLIYLELLLHKGWTENQDSEG